MEVSLGAFLLLCSGSFIILIVWLRNRSASKVAAAKDQAALTQSVEQAEADAIVRKAAVAKAVRRVNRGT